MSHSDRKSDHIRINLEEDVSFPNLTTGLERYRLTHQALPEVDLAAIDTRLTLFGKPVTAPILVSSMTGGTTQAGRINLILAEAAQARGLPLGLGSQRAAIEDPGLADSFKVRHVAPDILIFANLGAVQLNYGYGVDHCRRAVEMAEADALILHLNPLQEVVQSGGDGNWAGLLARMEQVCWALASAGIPVIVKEVGWGISEQAARHLINAGVSAIDVAGAGGTSWSEVEMHRAPTERLRRLARAFCDWGIPTAESLVTVDRVRREMGVPELPLFASGGMRTGQDIAKSVALGADLVGLAGPFLKKAVAPDDPVAAVVEEMEILEAELRIAMFVAGAENITALRAPGVIEAV